MTASVNVVAHPLVQHKLSLMRERGRSIKSFRELLNEIGMLLCYEVTRDLPLELVDIETPLAPMKAPMMKRLMPRVRASLPMKAAPNSTALPRDSSTAPASSPLPLWTM